MKENLLSFGKKVLARLIAHAHCALLILAGTLLCGANFFKFALVILVWLFVDFYRGDSCSDCPTND